MGNDGSTPEKSESRRQHQQQQQQQSKKRTDGSPSKKEEPRRKKSNSNKITKGVSGTSNPFLIFFLRMRSKKPNQPITVIAKTAGKLWRKMTPIERQKYINLANAAKKRKTVRKKPKKEPEDIE